ncbi:Biotin carboxylase [compost metagenome]
MRVDTHCYSGATVPPFYDSLLAKLIVHAPTRSEAIVLMRKALEDMKVVGLSTTASFHHAVLDHPDFVAGRVTTRWVEDVFVPARKQALKQARERA